MQQPRMGKNVFQFQPIIWSYFQTTLNQVLTIFGNRFSEVHCRVANLFILFERNVATDHVVQKDAEAPNSEGVCVVARETDPLRRRINARPVKVGVVGVL